MRKKSASEEPSLQPQKRRVIVLNSPAEQTQMSRGADRGFTLSTEPQVNENTNNINRQHAPSSVQREKEPLVPMIVIPHRMEENTMMPNKMEMIISSLLHLSEEVSGLISRLDTLESRFARMEERADNESIQPKKKPRRRADEINKDFYVS